MVFAICLTALVVGLIMGFISLGLKKELNWPWVVAFFSFFVALVVVMSHSPTPVHTTDATQVSAPEWVWEYDVVPDREGIYGHATTDGFVVITEDKSGVPDTSTYDSYTITDSTENKLVIKTQYSPDDQRWVPWHTETVTHVEIFIDTDKVEAR